MRMSLYTIPRVIIASRIIFTIACLPFVSKGQKDKTYSANLEFQSIGTSNGVVPFWLRSNQFGSIPLSGFSGSAIGNLHKDFYKPSDNKESDAKTNLVDWGFGIEGRANAGKGSEARLIEAYLKGRLSIFQLKVGRTRDVMGLNGDTALSSGNFAISGNALGIPKVEISIPDYWRIPLFNGLFSIKGNFAHGWMGRVKILDSISSLPPSKNIFYINDNNPKTYFHQKSLYGRIGREESKLSIYGGFSHQVFWGNERNAYGDNFKLSSLESFLYVVTGKAYGTVGVPSSKIGNQLGSIDLGAQYSFVNWDLGVYHQFFYDVGALSKLANASDGLTGVTFANHRRTKSKTFTLKKVILELFHSKNQAGYPWSTPTKSGDEDYYNNFYYKNGWSYKDEGLGNPLITKRDDAKDGQAKRGIEYFLNNRVVALHAGIETSFCNIHFLTKMTYSGNYGTFGTSTYGSSTGSIRSVNTSNIFKPVNEFSFYNKAEKRYKNGNIIGVSTGFDIGDLLDNSFGLVLSFKKVW